MSLPTRRNPRCLFVELCRSSNIALYVHLNFHSFCLVLLISFTWTSLWSLPCRLLWTLLSLLPWSTLFMVANSNPRPRAPPSSAATVIAAAAAPRDRGWPQSGSSYLLVTLIPWAKFVSRWWWWRIASRKAPNPVVVAQSALGKHPWCIIPLQKRVAIRIWHCRRLDDLRSSERHVLGGDHE